MDTVTKKCAKCGENKPLTGFHEKSNGKHGRTARCKICLEAARRKRYAATRRKRMKVIERKAWLWRNYITKKTLYDSVKPLKKFPTNRKEEIAMWKHEAHLWDNYLLTRGNATKTS